MVLAPDPASVQGVKVPVPPFRVKVTVPVGGVGDVVFVSVTVTVQLVLLPAMNVVG